MENTDVSVEDVPEANHLRAKAGPDIAGKAEYIRTAELIAFVHTEVPRRFEGMGVGSALARAGIELADAQGLKVLPVCPFISGWMDRHPEYDRLRYRPASRVED
ncbi:GNAT family N-acetyltransferase [Streptomyces sp. NPDC004609]|uniref:GNAT family N-acetyltransferase n=1 Tax=Streptomyces sp. NPDC004609 TaxID=3364704 RepID=UPI00369B65BC